MAVRGVHERVRTGLDLGGPRVDVERPGAATGDELSADVRVRVEELAHRRLGLLDACRPVVHAHDVTLVAHHAPHGQAPRASRVGEPPGVLGRAATAGHAHEHVDHDLL